MGRPDDDLFGDKKEGDLVDEMMTALTRMQLRRLNNGEVVSGPSGFQYRSPEDGFGEVLHCRNPSVPGSEWAGAADAEFGTIHDCVPPVDRGLVQMWLDEEFVFEEGEP